MKEIKGLRKNSSDDRDLVFRLVRIIAQIWQIHPFREGNTGSVVAFAVLLTESYGFEVDHELLKAHASDRRGRGFRTPVPFSFPSA